MGKVVDKMNKHLIVTGITLLFLMVVLSGCINGDKTLSDGTEVTGNTDQIEILNHEFIIKRRIRWKEEFHKDGPDSPVTSGRDSEVWIPWDEVNNIEEVNTNLSKRAYLLQNYVILHTVYNPEHEDWDENFDGFTISGTNEYVKIWIFDVHQKARCVVGGTAKNIGDSFINSATIFAHFYNADNAWLAKESYSESDKPSGYTWDFDMTYEGGFSNDVDYISFEVVVNE